MIVTSFAVGLWCLAGVAVAGAGEDARQPDPATIPDLTAPALRTASPLMGRDDLLRYDAFLRDVRAGDPPAGSTAAVRPWEPDLGVAGDVLAPAEGRLDPLTRTGLTDTLLRPVLERAARGVARTGPGAPAGGDGLPARSELRSRVPVGAGTVLSERALRQVPGYGLHATPRYGVDAPAWYGVRTPAPADRPCARSVHRVPLRPNTAAGVPSLSASAGASDAVSLGFFALADDGPPPFPHFVAVGAPPASIPCPRVEGSEPPVHPD